MRIIKIFTALVLFYTLAGVAQSNYAPWAKLSSDAPSNIQARTYPVPTKDEVGIPAYPGAVISSVSAPRTDTLEYKREILPFVTLVSTHNPSKVISFYQRNLKSSMGWNYNADLRTFVKGDIQTALTGFVPTVAIRDEDGEHFDLVNVDSNLKRNLKTRIEITYDPSNNE